MQKTITPLLTDWYKIGHPYQYHPNTDLVYSNLTARTSRIPGVDKVVVFGIQAFIKKYLIDHFKENFFDLPEDYVIKQFSRRIRTSLGSDLQPLKHRFYQENFPNDPYGHIRHLHRLQKLPLVIKALPEGSLVPTRVPFVTVHNSKKHPELYWLTNFIETLMSASTWQMITSATIAHEYKKIFTHYAKLTADDISFVLLQGHDFAFRGMNSLESAEYSGAAHLLSFIGTDTIPAIDFLENYYRADAEKEVIGVSVPATEHAVMCSNTGFYVWDTANGDWSKIGDCEFKVFKHIITELYPKGIVSIVSDTWDLWRVISDYLNKLKEEILARDGKVVIRPDSGDPADILCGLQDVKKDNEENVGFGGYYIWDKSRPNECIPKYVSEAEVKGVVELLWDIFGGTVTSKGFKLLDSHIGVIYGDSITRDRAIDICERLMKKGFASTNWVAGIGSYTYQYNTRDTFGMAVKATYCEALSSNNVPLQIPIFKDPITDNGTKKSAKGLLQVVEVLEPDSLGTLRHSTYELKDMCTWQEEAKGALQTIFNDGVLVKEYTLSEIRNRLDKHLK